MNKRHLDIDSAIKEYKDIKWDELLRDDLQSHHLNELEPHLDFIKKCFDKIILYKEDVLTINNWEPIFLDSLKEFLCKKDKILSFSDINRKTELVNTVKDHKNDILYKNERAINFLKNRDYLESKEEQEYLECINNKKKELDQCLQSSRKKEAEIKEILKAAREAAPSTAVTTFTEEFKNEASDLYKRSEKWLKATIAFAILTILVAIFFDKLVDLLTLSEGFKNWKTLYPIVTKVTIVGICFTGAVWCNRIYRALTHQAMVNRHRELSIKTFQAFVQATNNTYIKDAVLMAATKTIFASVPTGFIQQSDSQESGVNFVEFGKSSAEKLTHTAANTSDNMSS